MVSQNQYARAETLSDFVNPTRQNGIIKLAICV
jgi:hypothetical protein